ncbi:dephospho-CoA kinase [Uliginosibacterium sp. 31-12]|uniref:dephospho-CoA kinase n=1 Tax=Uliginosibacterium sp. 31-12 TaxID=3062781 RepID=UPI0026E23A04|nr:dephospho-CoA kinase [Uliginosibacterium sp. 31-12]MDO6387624.1 dephospho-CoA kinase [Uliginosibacterium sp. 31-12]
MKIASQAEQAHACVIGLTGGIACGKSTVAELFTAHGAGLVDTDRIAHQLTAPRGAAMPAIVASFGADMQRPDGALDRAAMRALVFAEPSRRTELEAILHPLIRSAGLAQLKSCAAPYVLLAVPLLVETGHYLPLCRRVLLVDCAEDIQLQRVMARSGLAEAEARRIIASQATRAARLAVADDVLDNSGSPAALPAQVAKLHAHYLQLAAQPNQNP